MKSTSKSKVAPVFSPSDVSTVHQSRCAVFQPTRRPGQQTRVQYNAWGTTTVKGRLGQNHQDVLDACFAVAERRVTASDGRIFLQIDPYLLRKKLNDLPHAKIESWLQELRSATVEIRVPSRKIWALGGIIDEAVESAKPIPPTGKPGTLHNKERHYLRVVVSRIWAGMMAQDLPTNYGGQFGKILTLKSGISQAVARLMLTHAGKKANMGIDEALVALGASIGHGHKARVVADLRADAVALAEIGITVGDTVISVSASTPPVPGQHATRSRSHAARSRTFVGLYRHIGNIGLPFGLWL